MREILLKNVSTIDSRFKISVMPICNIRSLKSVCESEKEFITEVEHDVQPSGLFAYY